MPTPGRESARVITCLALPVTDTTASRENTLKHVGISLCSPVCACGVLRGSAFERTFLVSCVVITRSDSAKFEYVITLDHCEGQYNARRIQV